MRCSRSFGAGGYIGAPAGAADRYACTCCHAHALVYGCLAVAACVPRSAKPGSRLGKEKGCFRFEALPFAEARVKV